MASAGWRRCAMRRCMACVQHLALGVEARAAPHLETGGGEPVAHDARAAPGGRGRVDGRQALQALQHARLPHRRVLGRRKAIEVERVDLGHPLRQPRGQIP